MVRIGADGTAVDLTPPLPVGRDVMGEPTGPYKVRVHAGRVYVSQGWPDVDRAEGPLDHAILALAGGARGAPHVLAAGFWNPYDFEWGGDAWYVVDAGRNALMRMEADGAGLTAVFAFPRLQYEASALKRLSPTVFKPGEVYEVDAVPTGLAIAGGRVFVALFGGFPYVEQGGAVVSLPLAGAAARSRLEVTRLNAPIDLAFAADGRLLVLEMGRFDLERGFVAGSGRLTAIDLASGAREILASALDLPVTVVPLPAGGAAIAQMAGGIIRLARVAQ